MFSLHLFGLPVDGDLLPIEFTCKLLLLPPKHRHFIFVGLLHIGHCREVRCCLVVEFAQIGSHYLWKRVMVRVVQLDCGTALVRVDHSLYVFHDSLF